MRYLQFLLLNTGCRSRSPSESCSSGSFIPQMFTLLDLLPLLVPLVSLPPSPASVKRSLDFLPPGCPVGSFGYPGVLLQAWPAWASLLAFSLPLHLLYSRNSFRCVRRERLKVRSQHFQKHRATSLCRVQAQRRTLPRNTCANPLVPRPQRQPLPNAPCVATGDDSLLNNRCTLLLELLQDLVYLGGFHSQPTVQLQRAPKL